MSAIKPTVNDDELPNPEFPGRSEMMAMLRGLRVAHLKERRANHIVLDVFDSIDALHDAIRDPISVFGEVGHRQRDGINVLIDRRPKHRARIMMKIARIVCSAAKKTDPKRGS